MKNKIEWKLILYFLGCNIGCRILLSLIGLQSPFLLSEFVLSLSLVIFLWIKDLKKSLKCSDIKILIPQNRFGLKRIEFLSVLIMLIISISFYCCFFDKIKFCYLLQSHFEHFGFLGLISFAVQFFYFAVEIASMAFIVSLVPVISISEKVNLEVGGLFLAVSWGASHFITGSSITGNIGTDFNWSIFNFLSSYNLMTGIYYMVLSLFIGILCVVFKRNMKWTILFSVFLYLI